MSCQASHPLFRAPDYRAPLLGIHIVPGFLKSSAKFSRPSSFERGNLSVQMDLCSSQTNQTRKNDGLVIVDHGSRSARSNSMLDAFVSIFKKKTGHSIVEPAHMELAEPTIKDAFDKCVQQGATRIIVAPYFLSPGRHWEKDIPELASNAATSHPNIPYLVTAPIGLHEAIVEVIEARIEHCLSHAAGEADECNMCVGTGGCQLLQSPGVVSDI